MKKKEQVFYSYRFDLFMPINLSWPVYELLSLNQKKENGNIYIYILYIIYIYIYMHVFLHIDI